MYTSDIKGHHPNFLIKIEEGVTKLFTYFWQEIARGVKICHTIFHEALIPPFIQNAPLDRVAMPSSGRWLGDIKQYRI